MTPEEKAFELVNKIFNEQHVDDRAKLITISSKKIALICVDEILSVTNTNPDFDETEKYNYFQDVKSEIEKL